MLIVRFLKLSLQSAYLGTKKIVKSQLTIQTNHSPQTWWIWDIRAFPPWEISLKQLPRRWKGGSIGAQPLFTLPSLFFTEPDFSPHTPLTSPCKMRRLKHDSQCQATSYKAHVHPICWSFPASVVASMSSFLCSSSRRGPQESPLSKQ